MECWEKDNLVQTIPCNNLKKGVVFRATKQKMFEGMKAKKKYSLLTIIANTSDQFTISSLACLTLSR